MTARPTRDPPRIWRVVEVGDGQVSDLPAHVDATPVFVQPNSTPTPSPNCGQRGAPSQRNDLDHLGGALVTL